MLSQTRIIVGTSLSWDEIHIPVYRYMPSSCKKVVYLQSWMHGGEVTIRVLHKLLERIIANIFPDIWFILVPLANPAMWEQHLYYSTAGKFSLVDGRDPNRSFPGNPQWSLADRVTFTLYQLANEADIIIDLHTSRDSVPFAIFHSEQTDIINTLGLPLNQIAGSEKYKSTLSGCMHLAWKTAFTIECWSHDEHDTHKMQVVSKALERYLHTLSSNNTKPNITPDALTFHKLVTTFSDYSWFIEYLCPLGSHFQATDTLARILLCDQLLQPIEIVAPGPGILLKRKKSHIIRYGDEIFQYIPD